MEATRCGEAAGIDTLRTDLTPDEATARIQANATKDSVELETTMSSSGS